MAVDGLLLRASLEEIRGRARGARVERIHQPRPETLTLTLYQPGAGTLTMLADCSRRFGRVHLTARRLENPPSPPAFCMLLRKHLAGRRLLDVEQSGLDRVAVLSFGAPGQAGHLRLVIELAGRAANIVLVAHDGLVLDALRRRPGAGGGRVLIPGAPYEPPGRDERLPLDALDPAALARRLDGAGEGPLWRVLLGEVEGPGPDAWREVALRTGVDPDLAWGALSEPARRRLLAEIGGLAETARGGRWELNAVVARGRYRALAAIPLHARARHDEGRVVPFARPSELCDEVYSAWEEDQALNDQRQQLAAVVGRALARAQRRRDARRGDLARAGEAGRLRRCGELLLAQPHLVPRGRDRVTLVDLFDDGRSTVEIALDPALTPAANAQRYFDRARKLERAQVTAARLLDEASSEVRHLQAVQVAVEQAEDLPTLAEVAAELRELGYLPGPRAAGPGTRQGRRTGPPRQPPRRSQPLRLTSRDGWTLLVGRNNRQNDELTFRTAAPTDWWFHVKDEAGAHVIARPPGGRPAGAVPAATLEDAALAAAYYSAARNGQNVPVDYTQRRRVRKPAGSRPGFVVYEGHRTVFVTPDPAHLERLAAGEAGTSPREPGDLKGVQAPE